MFSHTLDMNTLALQNKQRGKICINVYIVHKKMSVFFQVIYFYLELIVSLR